MSAPQRKFKKDSSKKKKSHKNSTVLIYRGIPLLIKVRIKTRTYETATNAASPLFSIGGLVEFLGYPGSYADTLYGLYKFACVRASKITLRLVNAVTEPVILTVAPMPYTFAVSTPTVAEILHHPKVSRTVIGSSSGESMVQ